MCPVLTLCVRPSLYVSGSHFMCPALTLCVRLSLYVSHHFFAFSHFMCPVPSNFFHSHFMFPTLTLCVPFFSFFNQIINICLLVHNHRIIANNKVTKMSYFKQDSYVVFLPKYDETSECSDDENNIGRDNVGKRSDDVPIKCFIFFLMTPMHQKSWTACGGIKQKNPNRFDRLCMYVWI